MITSNKLAKIVIISLVLQQIVFADPLICTGQVDECKTCCQDDGNGNQTCETDKSKCPCTDKVCDTCCLDDADAGKLVCIKEEEKSDKCPCTEKVCETCCKEVDGQQKCISDILKCPLNPNPDFDVLVTILYILGGFIIGIPLFLFIVDKIFCSNLFNCKMSLCECFANYICCCLCLSRDKPPIEFEDIDENEMFDDKKKKGAGKSSDQK